MKKSIMATLVGTIILFVYQALSWMALPIHTNSFKHTTAQENVLAALSGLEDGMYMIPGVPPGSSAEEKQKLRESLEGKPIALVQYTNAHSNDMGTPMLMGFIIDLIAVWIVVMILASAASVFNTFRSRLWVSLLFAVFCICQSELMSWNWFQAPSHFLAGEMIDDLLGWFLTGSWLAWYMGRGEQTAA